MEFTTERLNVRKPEGRDKADLVVELNNWQVVKNLSAVPYPYSLNDADAWIALCASSPFRSMITLRGRCIGGLSFAQAEPSAEGHSEEQPRKEAYELGYWISESHWGQGFVSEAVQQGLAYVAKRGVRRIVSCYFVGNEVSGHVLRKFGFRETGVCQALSLAQRQKVRCVTVELDLL